MAAGPQPRTSPGLRPLTTHGERSISWAPATTLRHEQLDSATATLALAWENPRAPRRRVGHLYTNPRITIMLDFRGGGAPQTRWESDAFKPLEGNGGCRSRIALRCPRIPRFRSRALDRLRQRDSCSAKYIGVESAGNRARIRRSNRHSNHRPNGIPDARVHRAHPDRGATNCWTSIVRGDTLACPPNGDPPTAHASRPDSHTDEPMQRHRGGLEEPWRGRCDLLRDAGVAGLRWLDHRYRRWVLVLRSRRSRLAVSLHSVSRFCTLEAGDCGRAPTHGDPIV